jgi:hypothetical protein
MKTLSKLLVGTVLGGALLLSGNASAGLTQGPNTDTDLTGSISWTWDGAAGLSTDTFTGVWWEFIATVSRVGDNVTMNVSGQHLLAPHDPPAIPGLLADTTTVGTLPVVGSTIVSGDHPDNTDHVDNYRITWNLTTAGGTLGIEAWHVPEPSTYAAFASVLLGAVFAGRLLVDVGERMYIYGIAPSRQRRCCV